MSIAEPEFKKGSVTFRALMTKTAECNHLRKALDLACSYLSDEQAEQVAAAMPPMSAMFEPVAWRATVGDLMFHAASLDGLLANLHVQFKADPDSVEPLYTHPSSAAQVTPNQ